jgi:hypothetical protein
VLIFLRYSCLAASSTIFQISTFVCKRIGHVFIIILLKYLSGKNHDNECQWKFDHYTASEWEMQWFTNITNLQTKVCATLRQPDHFQKSVDTLDKVIRFQAKLFQGSPIDASDEKLFSMMHYRYDCSMTSKKASFIVSQYIEPLIGLIRDPLTICSYEKLPSRFTSPEQDLVQSKRFFLLGPSAPYKNYQLTATPSIAPWLRRPTAKNILIDAGASLFNGADNPKPSSLTGARWFYEYFLTQSFHFDHIIAFEYVQYSPKTYWSQIPDDLLGKLTFINVGVETTGKFNPWNVLKNIAKPEDYVIVKLDIDTPHLELPLIKQIVDNASISSLIDEMFFEMHITVTEMQIYWGTPGGELKDTYELFTKLRRLGVRMHSWP